MDDPVADQPDGTDETPDGDTAGSSPIGLADAQARAREAVAELLEHPFDGIITAESGPTAGGESSPKWSSGAPSPTPRTSSADTRSRSTTAAASPGTSCVSATGAAR